MTFFKHYLEMVIAMFAGMFLLGAPLALLLGAAGVDVGALQEDAPELALLGMAFTMTVPMVAWMRYRGHGWAPSWEMAASMFVPTFAAIALYRGGVISDSHGLMMLQHVAMFPAMLVAMLLRRGEYSGHHHALA
jgi:hypothetical protein